MTRVIERISDKVLTLVAPRAVASAGCQRNQICQDMCAGSRAYAYAIYQYCSAATGWRYIGRTACGSC